MAVERLDPTTNLPFEKYPPPEPPPIPVPPTEQELRVKLQEVIAAQKVAEETLSRLQSTHERAEHHRQKCSRRLAEYATLDAEVVELKVTALKCDVGRIDVDLPDELRRRIADRDLARTDLQATEQALSRLRADLAEASAVAGDAAKAVDALLCAVLNAKAEGIAVQDQALMSDAERCARSLAAFDKFITPRGGMLPGSVRDVLMAEPTDMRIHPSGLGNLSTEAWHAAGDALKADVQARSSMDDLLRPCRTGRR
jgi:hypothetical protein